MVKSRVAHSHHPRNESRHRPPFTRLPPSEASAVSWASTITRHTRATEKARDGTCRPAPASGCKHRRLRAYAQSMETPFVRRPPLFFSLILEKKGKRFRVHISAARVLRPSSPPARRNRQQGVRVWQTKKKKKGEKRTMRCQRCRMLMSSLLVRGGCNGAPSEWLRFLVPGPRA